MKDKIEKFFTSEAFAVVGVSNKKNKFGTTVFQYFIERNLTVHPVNHHYNEFNGSPCFKSVTELPKNTKSIVMVVPPEETEKITQQCLDTGIENIWMQPGSQSARAIDIANRNSISVIHNECILMFLEPVKSFHAFHRWINKLIGKYPKN